MKKYSYRKPKNLSQKMKFLFGALLTIAALYYFSFNDYGIIQQFRTKKELEQIQLKIDTLKKQQEVINKNIQKLTSDPNTIEKLARENLQMIKEGEELYIIKKNTPADNSPPK